MKGKTILIVEDEIKISQLLQDYLHHQGYSTFIIDDGAKVLPWFERNKVDLILLDLMLPNKSGIEILTDIRKKSSVPIIMVTARVEEIDRIVGLELGADDYICKPFSPKEVIARVNITLKRVLGIPLHTTESIHLNEEKLTAQINSDVAELTLVEFKLLEKLMSRPGQIYNRQQLIENIYDDGRTVSNRTVDSHIKKLRQKLNGLCFDKEYIHSIYGVGYKFLP